MSESTENFDNTTFEDNEEEEEEEEENENGDENSNSPSQEQGSGSSKKKKGTNRTRRGGKRKITIEYIKDKSKRHITFSKRKAGIMKKAFELSTLTGTEVLLLVASETGHVYTFSSKKLQKIITQEDGKRLIQECLNNADPASQHAQASSQNGQELQSMTGMIDVKPQIINQQIPNNAMAGSEMLVQTQMQNNINMNIGNMSINSQFPQSGMQTANAEINVLTTTTGNIPQPMTPMQAIQQYSNMSPSTNSNNANNATQIQQFAQSINMNPSIPSTPAQFGSDATQQIPQAFSQSDILAMSASQLNNGQLNNGQITNLSEMYNQMSQNYQLNQQIQGNFQPMR